MSSSTDPQTPERCRQLGQPYQVGQTVTLTSTKQFAVAGRVAGYWPAGQQVQITKVDAAVHTLMAHLTAENAQYNVQAVVPSGRYEPKRQDNRLVSSCKIHHDHISKVRNGSVETHLFNVSFLINMCWHCEQLDTAKELCLPYKAGRYHIQQNGADVLAEERGTNIYQQFCNDHNSLSKGNLYLLFRWLTWRYFASTCKEKVHKLL
ncbi:hypothetical protein EDD18DRAFT_1132825 [Armillaria luteobubalina]|uniref:Uncharacterized protein n=1 Tax=Armillaria luteobubalina TaxID=153913 RepID=A0AA39QL32_9AGAR|nr:hypothetical protein EDD18DRAFT_1132825 [Armillaria luteobubalina]